MAPSAVAACYNCSRIKCPFCQRCHGCEGGSQFASPTNSARTQKAKGLSALSGAGVGTVVGIEKLIHAKSDLIHLTETKAICYFARPCPKRPRHGFVDSKVVTTKAELKAILAATLKADPEGELMLCQPLAADYNQVWTPTLLTVGRGNDGATIGSGCVSIPLCGKVEEGLLNVLSGAGVGPEESPYIEAVNALNRSPILTQLRAGPKLEGVGKNFLPHPMTVEKVILAKGDLLEWEATCVGLKDSTGTVVHHPGGSLTDHYSVHCRAMGIPILIDGPAPEVGDYLEPTTTLPSYDPAAVLRGVEKGNRVKLTETNAGRAVHFLLTTLYNSAALTGEDGEWLGAGVALMLRLGSAACAGEARHARKGTKPQRQTVYNKMFDLTLSRHRARLVPLIKALRYQFPSGKVGVGGENWAKCGATLIPLFNGISNLARDPTEQRVKDLILAFNVAVDQAHNGGWWLNKFTGADAFTKAQEGCLRVSLSFPDTLWDLSQVEVKDSTKYEQWPEVVFTPPPILDAEMLSLGESGTVDFRIKLKGRMFSDPRIIRLTTTDLITKLGKSLLSNVYAVEDENGIRLETRQGGEPITLYSDGPLTNLKGRSDK